MLFTAAFASIVIDAQLADQSWKIGDGISVRDEYTLGDGTRAGHMLYGCEASSLAIVEATPERFNPAYDRAQGRPNAEQAGVPFAFLPTRKEILSWN